MVAPLAFQSIAMAPAGLLRKIAVTYKVCIDVPIEAYVTAKVPISRSRWIPTFFVQLKSKAGWRVWDAGKQPPSLMDGDIVAASNPTHQHAGIVQTGLIDSVINLPGPTAARKYHVFSPSGSNDIVSVPRILFEKVLRIDLVARWIWEMMRERSSRKALWALFLVGALASGACRARASDQSIAPRPRQPVAPTRASDAKDPPPSGPSVFCKREGRPSHGALTVEWQAEDRVRRLSVDALGRVLRGGKVVASVSGGCIWDINGGAALIGTRSDGTLVGSSGTNLGTFTARAVLKIDGDALRVEEVLVLPDGAAKAIATDGSVYLAPRDATAFSLPATVTGDIVRGRRTAFMLFELGQRLPG